VFEGEANFKTVSGATEKILYKYSVAFDGDIFGSARRTSWNTAQPSEGQSAAKITEDSSTLLVRGKISAPFQFKTDQNGRIVEGAGTTALRFGKGLFTFGAVEFRNGQLSFKGPIKSTTRGQILSGSCVSRSEIPGATVGMLSSP
jgi:hypothetical protein